MDTSASQSTKAPELFDTHAHICSPTFSEQEQPEIIRRARASSVIGIINIATHPLALKEGQQLTAQAEELMIWGMAAATPPHDAHNEVDPFFPLVEEAVAANRLCAIGETGLEYYYHKESRKAQLHTLTQYAHLAAKHHLPIIIHCRDAFDDLFPILKDYGPDLRGVLHCFTGTTEQALALCELGYFISISGIATFGKSKALHQTIPHIPIDHLLIETDAPYLAPEPHRGTRNEPALITHIAHAVANIRHLPLEHIATATTHNAQRLFFPQKASNLKSV